VVPVVSKSFGNDYARSRLERAEMFKHLAAEARFTTFLFVGFSLADPNFNLIRRVLGDHLPAATSYSNGSTR
jgi:hypothetical protein